MSGTLDIDLPLPLLGGLNPERFMRRHWQTQPLLVRQALPLGRTQSSPIDRAALFALAAEEDVASRLVERSGDSWTLRHGPFSRRRLPTLKRPGWTLLVQGVDRHLPAAHDLLARFRFVPDARLDDLMVSYATDGGGVGPHRDSYDVFLLQVEGQRRWRVAPARRPAEQRLRSGLPLKILAEFDPMHEWVLDPGDMLYVPPGWAHDGVAVGACMTCSIGFRAPSRVEAGRETLSRLLDDAGAGRGAAASRRLAALYRDAGGPATAAPAELPPALVDFARSAALHLVDEPGAVARAVGVWLSEPPSDVWFEGGKPLDATIAVQLDRRSRMLYDADHVYLNGSAIRPTARDLTALRSLADTRRLAPADVARCSAAARALLDDWSQAGWLRST